MDNCLIFPAGTTPACQYAAAYLASQGIALTQHPSSQVTHLLLDVPSFRDDGLLRNGTDIEDLLPQLSDECIIFGGNLKHPALSDRTVIDLLQSEDYLCKNAAITAHCAYAIALQHLNTIPPESSALIIGWGRIGKCLGNILLKNGCLVTVVIRNSKNRSIANALEYRAISPSDPLPDANSIDFIINTAPHPVLSKEQLLPYSQCIKIDLASSKGLDSPEVIWARGLPGRNAPKSSGRLIANFVLHSKSGGIL